MRRLLSTFFVLSSFVLFSQEKTVDYIIKNVNIIPMSRDTVLKKKDIIVKNNKIYSITDHKNSRHKLKIKKKINGKGRYILPGLSDMHVHLPKDSTEIEKFLIMNLLNGITKIRSMRGRSKHIEWKKKYNNEKTVYPNIYLSAPPISKRSKINISDIDSLVREYKLKGFSFIKLLSVKNESFFDSLNNACNKYNVSLGGHFPGNVDDEKIFNSRINSIEHLGGLVKIENNLRKKRIQQIINNNIAVCPTLDWYNISYLQVNLDDLNTRKGIKFIDKNTIVNWNEKINNYINSKSKAEINKEKKEDSLLMKGRLEVLKYLIEKNVTVLLSPDSSGLFAIPGYNIIEEVRLYKKAGISNYNIIKCATINVSKYYRDNSFGTIEEGKQADFIFVKDNPIININTLENIQGVFYNNKYLDSKSLRKLAKKISPDKSRK